MSQTPGDRLGTQLRGELEPGLSEGRRRRVVRNLLDDLGSPAEIVAASAMPANAGLTVGVVAVLGLTGATILLPVIGPIIGL
jgi:hypothetical protein